jgi:hypothetical protein
MADLNITHSVLTIPATATEALAAHRLVIFTSGTTDAVEYPAAQYDYCFGVTLHAAAAGASVEVGVIGVFPVQVDGNAVAVVFGDSIGAHNDTGYGQDVVGAASRPFCAVALAGSTTDGDVIPCLFFGKGLTTA